MLNANGMALTYDSANRLLSAGGNTYTYDVENTKVKNLCNGIETQYSYNTNAGLSQLLVKTTGNTVTKYVYGNGLIGEDTTGIFKTYHFDFRGSTVAITDSNGTVTDTFTYDSYGNVISRTGTTDTIFLYNGEYGVITDSNGLLYMRARYYNPELRRFVNADILMGDINNSSTLNRYAYANGNPISNIDPFGLAADEGRGGNDNSNWFSNRYPNLSALELFIYSIFKNAEVKQYVLNQKHFKQNGRDYMDGRKYIEHLSSELKNAVNGEVFINITKLSKTIGIARETVTKMLYSTKYILNGKEKLFFIPDVVDRIYNELQTDSLEVSF